MFVQYVIKITKDDMEISSPTAKSSFFIIPYLSFRLNTFIITLRSIVEMGKIIFIKYVCANNLIT